MTKKKKTTKKKSLSQYSSQGFEKDDKVIIKRGKKLTKFFDHIYRFYLSFEASCL